VIRSAALAFVMLLAAVTASGCGNGEQADPPPEPAAEAGMPLQGEFGGTGPGSLLSANTLPTIDRRLKQMTSVAARITYLSTSGVDGSQQPISGTVFAPKGVPPEGGWPIIAFGHATSGIRPECAPSLDPMLLGTSTIVLGLVKAGYVVTATDYQGIGLRDTYHPYLDSTTEGFNIIDSVRAARKLVPATSNRWAGFGGSQGGQAVWAANELVQSYGADLVLVGTASYAAPLEFNGFADAAAAGALTPEQRPVLLAILASLANQSPALRLDDYRRGVAAEKWDLLLRCKEPDTAEREQAVDQIAPEDLRPTTPEAVELLRGLLFKMTLPRVPAAAPALVIYGLQDAVIPPAWNEFALDRACAMGDVVQIEIQPDRGHETVDASTAFPWLNERFRGDPPRNDCPAFVTRGQPTVTG
jgi:pimeloyl-ACP methyl ester carboxylesterase